MRDIKFRAWYKNKYLWPYPKGFNIIGEVTMFDCLKQMSIKDYDKIIIEQYTGLYDKNKNPIYEGDVVKTTKLSFVCVRPVYQCETGSWCIDLPIMGSTQDLGFQLLGIECEIIGNIHTEGK